MAMAVIEIAGFVSITIALKLYAFDYVAFHIATILNKKFPPLIGNFFALLRLRYEKPYSHNLLHRSAFLTEL